MEYLALYSRFFVNYNEEFDSLEQAKSFLEYGSDEGNLFDVCIIEKESKQIAKSKLLVILNEIKDMSIV